MDRVKFIDEQAAKYASEIKFRHNYSNFLKALEDYRGGYLAALKHNKITLNDEDGGCWGTSLNRIENLEWELKHEKDKNDNLLKTVNQLRLKIPSNTI